MLTHEILRDLSETLCAVYYSNYPYSGTTLVLLLPNCKIWNGIENNVIRSGCKGYLLPKTFLEDTADNLNTTWHCNICPNTQPTYNIQDTLAKVGVELSQMPKGQSSACKLFIKNMEKLFHPNHFYLVDVKMALAHLIGQEFNGGLPQVSDEDLRLKAQLCNQLIELGKMLAPAEKRMIGLLLFELHAAVAEIGRRRATSGEGGPEELRLSLLVIF